MVRRKKKKEKQGKTPEKSRVPVRFSVPAFGPRGRSRRRAFAVRFPYIPVRSTGIGSRIRRPIVRIDFPVRCVLCMLKKIVLLGLGNPGERYQFTRHNMGFMLLDHCAREHGLKWTQPAREYHRARGVLHGAEAVLLKPMTYVNLSGLAVRAFEEREEFSAGDALVICDDFNLPLGMLRLRRSGGDGGHNGLASIIDQLGINTFPRLRLGVGPLPPGVDPADFVLARFENEEMDRVSSSVRRAAECVETMIRQDIDSAMGKFNMRELRSESD